MTEFRELNSVRASSSIARQTPNAKSQHGETHVAELVALGEVACQKTKLLPVGLLFEDVLVLIVL
jgi:hypothetical protein